MKCGGMELNKERSDQSRIYGNDEEKMLLACIRARWGEKGRRRNVGDDCGSMRFFQEEGGDRERGERNQKNADDGESTENVK